MIKIERCRSQADWDSYVLDHDGHPLQLWGWGELKAAHNWRAERLFVKSDTETIGAAQVLIRSLPSPFKAMAYVPRGPVAGKQNRAVVLAVLAEYVQTTHGAVVVTIEPDWDTMPEGHDWVVSPNTILIPDTLILDLRQDEDELLGAMAKKTRQYIRKSGSEAIEIRLVKDSLDIERCLAIYEKTAERAGFAIHDRQYYRDLHAMLGDHSLIMAAYENNDIVAFLWIAISQSTAFELYGGVNERGQELRSNYALKWQTIRLCKEWGIERYDFNGLLNDGISTFKRSFASHESKLAGTYDKPLSPLYKVWVNGFPFAKKLLRAVSSLRK